ncbi:hypothetical protein DL765_002224 [Monosporascus sp. GIB2]|nr:hypothetical protein DL765_002224 [Monosporascus sp. GIB2]
MTSEQEQRPLLAADSESYSSSHDSGPPAHPRHGRLEDDALPEQSVLGRNIGWGSAYIIAISRVVGSGIFAVPGVILKSVGSVGLTLLLWALGAVVVACGLAVSLEYGCMLPRSGGDKVYLEFTYPRPRFLASTMVAVQAVLLGFTASNCIIFSQYVHYAFQVETSEASKKFLALALLTVITIIHGVWYKAGIRIQNFLGWVKVALVVFMLFAALYVVMFRPTQTAGSALLRTQSPWDTLWEGSDWSFGTLSTSLFKVFYSYAAYFAVVPIEEIKASGQLVAALFFEHTFGVNVGRRILSLAVALSAGGNVMVVTFALARLNQEIARAGFLAFSKMLSSSRPFGAPMGGLIVHYIPSFLVIALPPSQDIYSFILEVEGYPGQAFALATSIGLIWLRYKRPDLRRPFKAWLPAVVFRSLLSLALLAAPFFPPSESQPGGVFYATYAIVGVGILLFGFLYWLVWTVLLPHLGNYRLEEKEEVLDDGTAITVLARVPKLGTPEQQLPCFP